MSKHNRILQVRLPGIFSRIQLLHQHLPDFVVVVPCFAENSSVLQPGSTELMIVMELLSCSVADLVSVRLPATLYLSQPFGKLP
jgi:hypothetical protein